VTSIYQGYAHSGYAAAKKTKNKASPGYKVGDLSDYCRLSDEISPSQIERKYVLILR
jgi:hypothetical protein